MNEQGIDPALGTARMLIQRIVRNRNSFFGQKLAISHEVPASKSRPRDNAAGRSGPWRTALKGKIERIAFRKLECAEMLGVCPRTIDNMIADKQLVARKIGRSVIIPAHALYGLMCTFPPSDGTILRISYTKGEAAQALGVSERTIDNLIAAGELRSRKVRGRILIRIDDLHALLRCDHKTSRARISRAAA
jgi:excisionase family DNA binding protein